MLEIVRNLVSSIFGKILLAIMVLSFALWGVGDILSSGNSQLAAKVGKEKITLDEFYNEFQKTVYNYNLATDSNLNLKEAYEIDLHNSLLSDLIFSKMINNFAKNKNIFFNDESLKTIIKNLDQFKNDVNKFSEVKYKNYIFNNFDSEELFLKNLENTVYQGLIFENFRTNNYLNKSIIDFLYNFEGEKRSVNYFLIPENSLTFDKSNSAITEYFKINSNNYKVEKKTIIDYVEIDLSDFKNLKSISDTQVINYYENNIDQYSVRENRDIEFIRFNNESDALEFYNLSKKTNDEAIESYIEDNKISKSRINGYMGVTFPENITKTIFDLKNKEISLPIKYDDLGYYVFKILNINESKTQPIEEVTDEIKDYLALQEAFIDFDDTINIVDELQINDYSFDEILINLQKNKIRKAVFIEELQSKIKLENDVDYKNLPIGYTSEIIMSDNNKAFIFKIIDKTEAYVPELSEVINQVTEDYINYIVKKEINSKADKILELLQSLNNDKFNKYANKNNLKIENIENLERSNVELSTKSIKDVFENKQGNKFKIEFNNGKIGIGYVYKITKPDDLISQNFYDSVSSNIKDNFNASLQSIIGNEIIKNTSYEIYSQNIDKLFL